MAAFLDIQAIRLSLPGMIVTGITGGVVGSFMGSVVWIFGMALLGAIIGNIVWRLGGQHFFLFIVIGILLGSGLAIYLGGIDAALLGAGAGGAMGGFIGVNIKMLQTRSS
ncbi:MAG: hypothetical protein ACE5GK_06850 [Nitrospiria bacterium]